MGAVRRISALATGLLVLQLTLLGAAAPCADHSVGEVADAHHGHNAGLMIDPAPATGGHEDCDGTPAESDRTESPGGNCIAMISCVTPLPQLGAVLSVPDGISISRVAAVPLLEPPTRTTAPELPPPRA